MLYVFLLFFWNQPVLRKLKYETHSICSKGFILYNNNNNNNNNKNNNNNNDNDK